MATVMKIKGNHAWILSLDSLGRFWGLWSEFIICVLPIKVDFLKRGGNAAEHGKVLWMLCFHLFSHVPGVDQ
jgi:hypothetical protein